MDNQLTIKEGYLAMINYLDNLYQLGGSDDLADFLSSMQLTGDGSTMDPAAWNDWLRAVSKVVKDRNNSSV